MATQQIAKIRSFNRFYTDVIGVLDKHILNSKYTLAEVRILFELCHHKNQSASDLAATLSIDKGYLSRILHQFEKRKFIYRKPSAADTRTVLLSLTAAGAREFDVLNKRSDAEIKSLVNAISKKDRILLIQSMENIKRILTETTGQ